MITSNKGQKMSLFFSICMILICSTNAWEHWNPNRLEEKRTEADVAYADEDSNEDIKTSQIALQNEIYDEIQNQKNLETELSETDPRMNKKRQQAPPPQKPKPDGRPCTLAIKDCKQFEKCDGDLGNRVCVPLTMPKAPKRTPASPYQGSSVTLGADCTSSPDEINNVQIANLAVAEKKLKLGSGAAQPENFVQGVCNWKITRLECVPFRPKTVDLIPTTKPPPTSPDAPPDDDDKDKERLKQKGKCKCILALGERAVWVPNSYTNSRGTEFGRCYIPAGLGANSKCGHDIVIPSGYIETGKRVYKNVGSPSSFCAPGSTCRTGYNYVGLRCSCNKTHIFIPKDGTCKPNADAGQDTIQTSVLLLLLPLIIFLEIWRYIFGGITTT